MDGLTVDTALSGNHQISTHDSRFQPDCFHDDFDARSQRCTEKGQQRRALWPWLFDPHHKGPGPNGNPSCSRALC